MTKYEDGKRVCARAITFIDDKVLLIERHRLNNNEMMHYFTIPGGGVEDDEECDIAAIRETKEETCCDIEIVKPLIVEDYDEGICYWFYGKYLRGTPQLGGEEKVQNNPDNHYKVVLIDMKDIENINILGMGKQLVKECYEEYKKSNNIKRINGQKKYGV